MNVFPQLFKYLVFSNDSSSKKDGTGAQIQRMLAVAALAETLKRPFIQSKIEDIAVHPLDPFQQHDEYVNFLERLNHDFNFEHSQDKIGTVAERLVRNLSVINLYKIALQTYLFKKTTLIRIENPYSVSDINVDSYMRVIPMLRIANELEAIKVQNPYIAIHYRQGVGNFAIYPGQSISREIDLAHFKELIQEYYQNTSVNTKVVHVFTDAPSKVIEYNPPKEQLYLWEGTPGFKDGTMRIQPLKFTPELLGVDEIVLHSGGDPLDAIKQMALAEVLFTGRSSLSYVAGILNKQGIVYAAPNFWHPKLREWRIGNPNV